MSGQLMQFLAITLALLNVSAQIITIITPTPDPTTRVGKAYKIIETIAGIVGKAKDTGIPPAQK